MTGNLRMKTKDGEDRYEQTTNAVVGSDLVLALGNGPNAVALNPLASVGGAVTLKAGGGDDLVAVFLATIGGNLSLAVGNGANTIACTSATVGGAVAIRAGAGNDTIDTTNTVAAGGTTVDAGKGTNTLVPRARRGTVRLGPARLDARPASSANHASCSVSPS